VPPDAQLGGVAVDGSEGRVEPIGDGDAPPRRLLRVCDVGGALLRSLPGPQRQTANAIGEHGDARTVLAGPHDERGKAGIDSPT